MPSGDCSSGFMSPDGIYTDIYPNICTDIYTGKTRENIKYVAYETRVILWIIITYLRKGFGIKRKTTIFVILYGALAEWSGTGLQNLLQWFDSATHLQRTA